MALKGIDFQGGKGKGKGSKGRDDRPVTESFQARTEAPAPVEPSPPSRSGWSVAMPSFKGKGSGKGSEQSQGGWGGRRQDQRSGNAWSRW
jgi:hypothetical protein